MRRNVVIMAASLVAVIVCDLTGCLLDSNPVIYTTCMALTLAAFVVYVASLVKLNYTAEKRSTENNSRKDVGTVSLSRKAA